MSYINENFRMRAALTIDNTNIDSDLTNFTVIIDENATDFPGEFFSGLHHANLTDGRDIRASADKAGKIPLAIHIRAITASAVEIAIKVPTAYAAVLTTIYLWWGNPFATMPAASSTYGSQNAYTQEAVYDMRDVTTSTILDHTGNGHNGAKHAANEPNEVTGYPGKGQDFDGSDDDIDLGSFNELEGITKFTMMWRIRFNSLGDFETFIDKADDYTHRIFFSLGGTGEGGNNDITMALTNGADQYAYTTDNWVAINTNYTVHWVYDASETGNNRIKVYVNGVQKTLTYSGTIPAQTASITEKAFLGTGSLLANYLDGIMSEYRVSLDAKTAAWMKAEHYNLSDIPTFVSCGTPEFILIPDLRGNLKDDLSGGFQ